jgi:diacylglycerol kinase
VTANTPAVKRGAKVKKTTKIPSSIPNRIFCAICFIFGTTLSEPMSFKKRVASFRYAFQGLKDLFRSQANARIHLVVTLFVLMAGVAFQISRMEWMTLVFCVALVLSLEAVNTAIEYLTDLVSPTINPLAGKVKDMAAAAVLWAAIGAVVIGGLVFLPKIWDLISG